MIILVCTGCGNAVNIDDSKEEKENVTNENAVSGANVTNINSQAENIVDMNMLDTALIYKIINGNTGKQITLNDSQQKYMEVLLKNMIIQQEESTKSDEEKTMGYTYCIRALNENGEVSKTITLKGHNVTIDGKYYIVESTEDLVVYLDDLYK